LNVSVKDEGKADLEVIELGHVLMPLEVLMVIASAMPE
jgi:hypothetical protein